MQTVTTASKLFTLDKGDPGSGLAGYQSKQLGSKGRLTTKARLGTKPIAFS